MLDPDMILAVTPVVDALDRLGVPYEIAGSLASSYHGVPRSTLDADLVVALPMDKVGALAAALAGAYYADEDMIRDAVRRQASCNLVHLDTGIKVDLYLLKPRVYDSEAFARRAPGRLDDAPGAREFVFEGVEDVVLHKLEWYRLGGHVADRQWTDVVNVLRAKAGALDLAYLRRWAREIGVLDLFERALADAGG
jgi:hypothetical protein